MQMYDGLPIITNKIPEDERRGIPHHLLGCIGLQEPTWRVDRFVKEALRVVGTAIQNARDLADRVSPIDKKDSFKRTAADPCRWDALLYTIITLQ